MTDSAGSVRAFVAVELTEAVKRTLSSWQDQIRQQLGATGPSEPSWLKWVAPASLHLTLKFLGNVPRARIEVICEQLATCAAGAPPLRLRLGEPGAFPHPRRARVLWAGVEGDVDTLCCLHAEVERRLDRLGYPAEGKAFRPHLTLARLREDARPSDRAAAGAALARLRPGRVDLTVAEILLMRSDLRPSGPTYTPLCRARLGKRTDDGRRSTEDAS